MPSIAEISRKLGLSKATVSRAFDFRHCEMVRPETRQRIFSLCEELDYHPTFTGRSFSTGKTFKIGVLVEGHPTGAFSPFFTLCINAFGEAIQKQGFAVTMLYLSNQDSSVQIADFLKSSIADGYIILSQLIDDYVQEAICKCRQPVIMMDYVRSGITGLPVVSRDSVSAYAEAWGNTSEAERSSSAFVHFGRSHHKRAFLLKAAPQDAVIRDVVVPCANGNVLVSYRNAKQAASSIFDQFSAYKLLWCSSDILALALADTFREHGIAVGETVKIVGFDNIEGTMGGFAVPELSTVDPCWAECGRALAKSIIQEILEGRKIPASITVESKFIFRSSFSKGEKK